MIRGKIKTKLIPTYPIIAENYSPLYVSSGLIIYR